jgi:hypothetical protein
MTQPNIIYLKRQDYKSNLAHWSEIFLEIRHQFHTSIQKKTADVTGGTPIAI